MKRAAMFLAMAMAFLTVASCSKVIPDKGSNADIAGDWQLMDVQFQTKSAVIRGENITVYLRLSKDGSFGMWQQLGQGRFKSFTGTWSYSNCLLYTSPSPRDS